MANSRHIERAPLWAAIAVYVSLGIIVLLGHLSDFLDGVRDTILGLFGRRTVRKTHNEPGYAVLLKDWDNFYTRRMYRRISDCWNRPIRSAPGRQFNLVMRESTDFNVTFTDSGETRACTNFGSYNYLGFGDPDEVPAVLEAFHNYSVSMCSSRADFGTSAIHRELESTVARFVNKEASLVFAMGFATNSTVIPVLARKGDLLVSDANNHTSIVQGCRASGATIVAFQHNNPTDLERVLRNAVAYGQPRTHRPYNKIIVIVEGVYSMEGEICPLVEVVAVCKRYKAYVYLDEAHSIGAVGPGGRGITELLGVPTKDIDIMMGTFTKSFGSVGGYIAGTKEIVEFLRRNSIGAIYGNALSPPCAAQALYAMRTIMGEINKEEGERRIRVLHENSNYFRDSLIDLGFDILGDPNSPVVPLMLYVPALIPAFSRECLAKNLAVVVVGYPATPIMASRARFCVSAAHTKQDLDHALAAISEIGDRLMLKYRRITTANVLLRLSAVATVLSGIAFSIAYFMFRVRGGHQDSPSPVGLGSDPVFQ